MEKIKIDGEEFEVSAEVAKSFRKLEAKHDEALSTSKKETAKAEAKIDAKNDELVEAKKSSDKSEAKADGLEVENKKLKEKTEEKMDADTMDKLVEARTSICETAGKLGVLFPGQGAQYVGMLRDLACQFPEMLEVLESADAEFGVNESDERLSDLIYAHPAFDKDVLQKDEAALRATAWEGRFLVIGFTAGISSIPLNLPLLKGCQIVGVFLGSKSARDPEWSKAMQRELDALCAEGKLKPPVGKSYSLEQAPQALLDLIDRKALGRLVVTP